MDKTTLEIPTELLEAANLTPEEARKELAIRLYQLHKLNDRQAAELADDPKAIETLVWNSDQTGHFNLDDFLSWASHDLKTPLNSVIGFTNVVLKGICGPINETQETDLSTVFRAGQRMLALIGYLVEIARLNNGHTKLSLEKADISEIIEETTKRWKTQYASKPLHTELTIADPTFSVDRGHIRQVFSHLLTLASIRLTEGTVTLTANDSDNTMMVRIQSNGTKSTDKLEMDVTMLRFITDSLIKLHGGRMDEPQETDDGLLLRFSLPR